MEKISVVYPTEIAAGTKDGSLQAKEMINIDVMNNKKTADYLKSMI